MRDGSRVDGTTVPRPLTKSDLDRRIETILAEIAPSEGEAPLRPRVISAADLVARVRPLLSMN